MNFIRTAIITLLELVGMAIVVAGVTIGCFIGLGWVTATLHGTMTAEVGLVLTCAFLTAVAFVGLVCVQIRNKKTNAAFETLSKEEKLRAINARLKAPGLVTGYPPKPEYPNVSPNTIVRPPEVAKKYPND